MAKENEKKVVDEEVKDEATPKKEESTEKIPLRKRIGMKLMSDEPIVKPKVKKVAAIVGGALITAGLAVGGVLLKQHMDGVTDGADVGLLPEGEAPFELNATDYVVSEADQA